MNTEKEKLASLVLLTSAVDLEKKSEEIGLAAKTREQSSKTVKEISTLLESKLAPAINAALSDGDSSLRLASLIKAVQETLQGIKLLGETLSSDAAKLSGKAEGVSLASKSLRERSAHHLREANRIEELAKSEKDLDARRAPGERPETLRVKRKAAAMRENNQKNDNEGHEDNS